MSTFLFDSIVFGPVRSRRLGVSLGINLLPVDRKVCNFNCIYCECGWTYKKSPDSSPLPSREEVREALATRLSEMQKKGEKPDVITYAGNGEPTMHPDFAGIIEDSIELRNIFFPDAKISVLSNGTTIHRRKIREALLKADMNILKLDSVFPATIKVLNQNLPSYNLQNVFDNMKLMEGKFIIQTLFVKGEYNGQIIDNTTREETEPWLEKIRELHPASVMIYTIDRDTPLGNKLHKVPVTVLREIASRVEALGIPASVSG